ncbi:class I SAM-dependent methyltransferase [Cyanobacteria bacterium FACHB-471]|nr:class I SAM-dependent methyltransferase [Cyanobacteria bacterium FACHB-471]
MDITLDYPVNPQPRYGYGKPPHAKLHELIDKRRQSYKEVLNLFLKYESDLLKLPKVPDPDNLKEPAWINSWIPGSDSTALYCLLRLCNPGQYFEIGSGNSTKFARRAITDGNLRTKIFSFDPQPRDEVNSICDSMVRKPIEDVDVSIFEQLEEGDFLFVDNSHRLFMNSDVAVVFLDILPRLKRGIFVEFHDVFLPFDYPPQWKDRHYSEQYMLAAYLLAEGKKFDVLLPNAFVGVDPELSNILLPLWKKLEIDASVARHGSSFWIRTN